MTTLPANVVPFPANAVTTLPAAEQPQMQPDAQPGPSTRPAPRDELEEDYITVPGQLYALVSFVAPTGTNQRSDKFGLKIRGCFATREEARSHVNRLQQMDKTMDIYLVDMYKWLLIPPDPNAIDDQEYQEDFLNNLIKGYRESQAMAKQHFQERKESVRKEGLDKHLLEHEKLPPPAAGGDDVDRALFEEQDPILKARAAAASGGGA